MSTLIDVFMLAVNAVIRVRGLRAAIKLDGALPRMVLVMILDASSSCLAQLCSQVIIHP